MLSVEIYFRDLSPEGKKKVLHELQTSEEDENWNYQPLAIVDREEGLEEED